MHILFSDLYYQKPKNTSLNLFAFILFAPNNLSLYQSFTREGLTTPLLHRVASICSLCAGTIHIVLLRSPTGSITLVSQLREIPTFVVLHHPLFIWEKTYIDTIHKEKIKHLHYNGFARMDHHTKLSKKKELASSSSTRPVTNTNARAIIDSNLKKISQLNKA